MRWELKHVHYMPSELQPGVLYVSDEFEIAAHLCACGCEAKVRTPLDHTEWKLEETTDGPSLYPSIGNWQLPCQSHYWIRNGQTIWAPSWTPEEIAEGRRCEIARREAYYEGLHKEPSRWRSFWNWVKRLFLKGRPAD